MQTVEGTKPLIITAFFLETQNETFQYKFSFNFVNFVDLVFLIKLLPKTRHPWPILLVDDAPFANRSLPHTPTRVPTWAFPLGP